MKNNFSSPLSALPVFLVLPIGLLSATPRLNLFFKILSIGVFLFLSLAATYRKLSFESKTLLIIRPLAFWKRRIEIPYPGIDHVLIKASDSIKYWYLPADIVIRTANSGKYIITLSENDLITVCSLLLRKNIPVRPVESDKAKQYLAAAKEMNK